MTPTSVVESAVVPGGLRLNLGCGPHMLQGYINVDKFGTPDLRWDLELTPWPWETDSVGEVVMSHILEHLGQTPTTFLAIVRELYRVCRDATIIRIIVPHPRHDHFMTDPTHIRAITPDTLALFSKRLNREWIAKGIANSTLGLYLDVDFEVTKANVHLEEPWHSQLIRHEITIEQVAQDMRHLNNVATQFTIDWRVLKPRA